MPVRLAQPSVELLNRSLSGRYTGEISDNHKDTPKMSYNVTFISIRNIYLLSTNYCT